MKKEVKEEAVSRLCQRLLAIKRRRFDCGTLVCQDVNVVVVLRSVVLWKKALFLEQKPEKDAIVQEMLCGGTCMTSLSGDLGVDTTSCPINPTS